MAAPLVMGHMRTSLCSVFYCAGCSTNYCQIPKNCQHEKTLTLALWGCLALVKQWNITAYTYFTSSQMQTMGTWQKTNFLGCQCRFMKDYMRQWPNMCSDGLCLEPN